MSSADGRLVWLDCETSGLVPDRDYLLEVGLRITDGDLVTVAEASWVVHWDADFLATVRAEVHPDVQAMHEANGLWAECALPGPGAYDVTTAVAAWLTAQNTHRCPLAGSSVGFDRGWMTYWLPIFPELVGYRTVDVSTVKELLARWAPDLSAGRPVQALWHRVMPDLDDSIAELAYYRTALGLDVRAVATP